MPSPTRFFRPQGATLIEATIAIGIFAFAFLAIWGALNVGAAASRNSKNLVFISQIQQRLLSAATEKDGDLSTLTNALYYFDGEGLDLASNATDLWAYQARLYSSSPSQVAVPGGAANTNLLLISVEVKTRAGDPKTARQLFLIPQTNS